MRRPSVGHVDRWKILEEMIADFRKKGRTVPTRIISDLKSARTMIRILKADPSYGESVQKIEEYLWNVESYLVSEGEKVFGRTYVEEWLRRLGNESRRLTEEKEEIRFVSGLPRKRGWVRVRPSAELTIDVLKAMVDDLNLSYKIQDDGSMLVYGKREHIKNFVKKMTTEYGSKAKK
jgi:hypothetical protein